MSSTGEARAAPSAGTTVSAASISITCTQPNAATSAAPGSAAEKDAAGGLAVLALTGPLLQELLQHHPHGGVREQLHAAGLLQQRQTLLVALWQKLGVSRGWRSCVQVSRRRAAAAAAGCLPA
jgi:hypothetical protein